MLAQAPPAPLSLDEVLSWAQVAYDIAPVATVLGFMLVAGGLPGYLIGLYRGRAQVLREWLDSRR